MFAEVIKSAKAYAEEQGANVLDASAFASAVATFGTDADWNRRTVYEIWQAGVRYGLEREAMRRQGEG